MPVTDSLYGNTSYGPNLRRHVGGESGGPSVSGAGVIRAGSPDLGTAPVPNIVATPTSVTNTSTLIYLEATATTDAEGGVLEYKWELVSGPEQGLFVLPSADNSSVVFDPTL